MNKRNVIISILLIILVILLLIRKQVVNVFRTGDNVSLETSVNEYKLDPLEYIPRGINLARNIWASDAICGCDEKPAVQFIERIKNNTVFVDRPQLKPLSFAPIPVTTPKQKRTSRLIAGVQRG